MRLSGYASSGYCRSGFFGQFADVEQPVYEYGASVTLGYQPPRPQYASSINALSRILATLDERAKASASLTSYQASASTVQNSATLQSYGATMTEPSYSAAVEQNEFDAELTPEQLYSASLTNYGSSIN